MTDPTRTPTGPAGDAATRRVLIAGCGDVGTAAGLQLAQAGATVFGLRRDATGVPAPIVGIAGDLTDRRSLDAVPAVDAVLFTAAPAGRTVDDYRACYLDGLRNVVQAATRRSAAPVRVVVTSSTAVYGQDDGSLVDESSPLHPRSATAEVLVEAEEALGNLDAEGVVLRVTGIYGPGRLRLVREVAEGRARRDTVDPWTNRVHRDDLARALVTVMDLPAPSPGYIVVDDRPARRNEVLTWLADRLGVPEPPLLPDGQAARTRGGSKRCSNRLLRATGWAPRYPSYRDGYPALLPSGR